MDKIEKFSGKYRFLSNFYPSLLRYREEIWPTVEHAYQAAKSSDPEVRNRIRLADTPKEAKRLGRRCRLRPDWEETKLEVMLELLRIKFSSRTGLGRLLLLTGDAELIEGNYWGDRFWGVDLEGKGENHLGRLLMQVRDEIRKETE